MKRHRKIFAFVFCSCLATHAYAQGILTYDPSDVAQTTITAEQAVTQTARQLQQYQAQLQQLQNQIQNTNNPSSFQWDNANATINNILATLNTLNTYKTQAGNMNAYLNQYQNANQYQTSCIGTGGCTDAQIQQLNNSQLVGSTSQKTANDNMLLNINAQQQQLQSDANNLITLQQNAQTSTGQMQAMQAANQLASNQAAQLLQIRTLLVAEQTANATRAETTPDMNNQLKHIIDYLHAALTDGGLPKEYSLTAMTLQASTYQVIAAKAESWTTWQSKQTIHGEMELGRDYDVVMALEGGMRLVELKTPLALDYEGQQMGHCIGGSYDGRLNGKGGYRQYSLWDAKGAAHCTFEAHNGTLQQCQGKKNQPPVARYVPAVMAAILARGWKLGNIPAARTGLVTDRHGQIYSVHDLPEVFEGDLNLTGLQTGVCLPRHVTGSVAVQNAVSIDLSRLEKIDGDLNAYGTPMKETTTAHLRAIQVRGNATWPLGVINDKRDRVYSAYDLCDELFDGDVDLSGTNVTSLGQHCKKITGRLIKREAIDKLASPLSGF